MSRPTRTFIALTIPEEKAEKLARLQGLIAPSLPGCRWTAPRDFHVTLAFLGDIPVGDLNALCLAVAEAASPFPPLPLIAAGLGVFPNAERPRVVWVGLSGPGSEALKALRDAVAGAAASVGYPPEDDRFSPHVTLGRMKPGRGPSPDVGALLRHYERWSAGAFSAGEVVTFASAPTPEGSAYLALNRCPLRDRKSLDSKDL